MSTGGPSYHHTVESLVEEALARVGKRVVLGTPLGLGKANHVVNAFYRRAAEDPSIHLTVYTALSLAAPRASSELERRLVEPLNERVFGGYPELAWVDPQRSGTDLTDVELTLTRALRGMKRKLENRDLSLLPDLDEVKKLVNVPDEARPYLERMALADPDGLEENLLQRAVVYALVTGGYL